MDKNIFLNLSWKASLENQQNAINTLSLKKDLDLKELIQHMGKEYWENCAKTLIKIGYPKIKEVIPDLFRWLQDLNWSGTSLIMDFLKTLPREVFLKEYESSISEAIELNDEIWLENPSDFIQDLNIKEFEFKLNDNFTKLYKYLIN